MKKIIRMAGFAALFAALGATAYTYRPQDKLRMAQGAIEQFYVDTVNSEKVTEGAIRGMLKELDPHSAYSDPEETRELNEPLQGNFSGIGITYNMNQDTLYVIQTVSGGPSAKVGIQAGDRIIAVDGESIAGRKLKNSQIQKMLRGEKGTVVNVTVLRREGNSSDTVPFLITRAEIPIKSVDAAYMADPTTGYIRLNKFAAETPDEVLKAFSRLRKRGMRNLILDLTDNGGGYLNAAVRLLSEFLDPGNLLVYTEGRNSPRYNHVSVPEGAEPAFSTGRLVVMANQNSASASEITAGAIQDYDRGLIVGRRSFGKGLVQRPFPFPDGSMMRLTVAHYYTPTGRDIQKPYVKGSSDAYEKDLSDRFKGGELMHRDSIKYVDSLKVYTRVNHRPVYGGGGIYPDIFVPLDTSEYTRYYRDVMAKGLLNTYAIKYVDKNRKSVQREYRNADNFVKRFEITDKMLDELYGMAKEKGVEPDPKQAKVSAPLFRMILKGLIGRDIFEDDTYFKVYNLHDPIFREALRIINSPDYDDFITGRKTELPAGKE